MKKFKFLNILTLLVILSVSKITYGQIFVISDKKIKSLHFIAETSVYTDLIENGQEGLSPPEIFKTFGEVFKQINSDHEVIHDYIVFANSVDVGTMSIAKHMRFVINGSLNIKGDLTQTHRLDAGSGVEYIKGLIKNDMKDAQLLDNDNEGVLGVLVTKGKSNKKVVLDEDDEMEMEPEEITPYI